MNQNSVEKLKAIKTNEEYDQYFVDFVADMCKEEPNDQELGKQIRFIFSNLSDETIFH